jgi:hypothetical protein
MNVCVCVCVCVCEGSVKCQCKCKKGWYTEREVNSELHFDRPSSIHDAQSQNTAAWTGDSGRGHETSWEEESEEAWCGCGVV